MTDLPHPQVAELPALNVELLRQRILQNVTDRLHMMFLQSDPDFKWGGEQPQPNLMYEELIVVPPYNDGFMGFHSVIFWVELGTGRIHAKNCYGETKWSYEVDEIAHWALTV